MCQGVYDPASNCNRALKHNYAMLHLISKNINFARFKQSRCKTATEIDYIQHFTDNTVKLVTFHTANRRSISRFMIFSFKGAFYGICFTF